MNSHTLATVIDIYLKTLTLKYVTKGNLNDCKFSTAENTSWPDKLIQKPHCFIFPFSVTVVKKMFIIVFPYLIYLPQCSLDIFYIDPSF